MGDVEGLLRQPKPVKGMFNEPMLLVGTESPDVFCREPSKSDLLATCARKPHV